MSAGPVGGGVVGPDPLRPRPLLALALLAVGLGVVGYAHATGDAFLLRLFSRVCVLALAAVALDLCIGLAGLVSLGHAAFVGIGAYAVGVVAHHGMMAPPLFGVLGGQGAWLTWPLAMAAGALFALLTGLCALRTRGLGFIMITLAFAQMAYFLLVAFREYGGEDGMTLFGRSALPPLDLNSNLTFALVCLGLLAVAVAASRRFAVSPMGEVLRAAAANERRAKALGYPVVRYRLALYCASGALAGLSGALLAELSGYVGPAYLSWQRSGELIFMVVLGGVGSLYGAVVGAASFVLLEEALPGLLGAIRPGWSEYWHAPLGLVLLLVVLGARGGLLGLLDRLVAPRHARRSPPASAPAAATPAAPGTAPAE